MRQTVIIAAAVLIGSASVVAADEVRVQPYGYSYGDTVKSVEEDSFLACADCKPDELKKLPKPILSARVPKEVVPPNIAANEETTELTEYHVIEQRPSAASGGVSSRLGSVRFHLDSDRLTKEDRRILDNIAKKNQGGAPLSVSGYTCTLGSKKHNQSLSERRAQAVAEYLRNKGVEVVSAAGKGECCPVSSDKKLNRRVDIELTKTSEGK